MSRKDELLKQAQKLESLIFLRTEAIQDKNYHALKDSMPQSGDEETADAATDLFDQTLDLTFKQRYSDRLAAVKHSLYKISVGEYGICERCHQPIPAARLDIIPEACFCVSCEGEIEVLD
jgi:DnaK suppressor protein